MLGKNIKELMSRNRKPFSLNCAISLAIKLVDLLEALHDQGFIHCDLKPDNIMIGNYRKDLKLMNKIFLIDFGISQRYLNDDGTHKEFYEKVPFMGNLIFSSKNAFREVSLSRRDDIISLVYVLQFLIITKNLSWINEECAVNDQWDRIARYKVFTTARNYCTEETKFLYPLLKYAYKLEFKESPDYNNIRFLLKKILLDKNYIPDCQFDWSKHPDHNYNFTDPNDKHSSISSCDIGSDENTDCDHADRLLHLRELKDKYQIPVKNAYHLMKQGANSMKGNGEKYFKIPNNFIKVGEYQYRKNE